MIDVCINNGSCWNVELIESQYINISTYRPLSRSFYINLPLGLRSPEKRIINKKKKKRKKKTQKCFLWCHVRHINPSRKHQKKLKY